MFSGYKLGLGLSALRRFEVSLWKSNLNILYLQGQNKSNIAESSKERIVITDDGSTVVCWHPEKSFPYECSKPLPKEVSEEDNSVLKVQNLSSIYDVFKPKNKEQTREELMKLTSTNKHIWYPRGKKYYKKNAKPTPRNRDYL